MKNITIKGLKKIWKGLFIIGLVLFVINGIRGTWQLYNESLKLLQEDPTLTFSHMIKPYIITSSSIAVFTFIVMTSGLIITKKFIPLFRSLFSPRILLLLVGCIVASILQIGVWVLQLAQGKEVLLPIMMIVFITDLFVIAFTVICKEILRYSNKEVPLESQTVYEALEMMKEKITSIKHARNKA